MEGIFCRKLLRHLETAVAQQEQVILFQNRRGYAPYMSCNECGTARKCKYCDVSLTYHKFTNSLSCHYCGYSTAANSPCSKCKSTDLGMEGFGTEKIEDELQLMYPDLRIARLDQDTTRTKTAHSDTIKALETGKIDVLVGTQMVSKGLDFEHVNTVGIMDADAMLNYPDFRANERAFQLLTQVSGRAGRKHKRGLVLIQTRQPEHQVLQWVINNETEQLFLAELTERKLFNYPPFARLVRIHIKHKADITAAKAAAVLANGLRLIQGLEVLGPQQPPIGKVRDLFLQLILLKIIDTKELDRIKRQILQQVRAMAKDSVLKTAMYVIDVDPM
jgi:primosomal protein N' (replication factor Y)